MGKEIAMDFDTRENVANESWLSEEFPAIDRKEILRHEHEQFMLRYALCEEELPDDPVKCGEYFDLLEAIDESTIK